MLIGCGIREKIVLQIIKFEHLKIGQEFPAMRHSIIVLWLLALVNSQDETDASSTRIAGIGVGTFIIVIAILFSIVWCLACRSSSRPEIYSILGLIVPVILIIVFAVMPKEADREPTAETTDLNFVTHVVFLLIAVLGFILSILFSVFDIVLVSKKAKNIARSAFVIKQEEEEALTGGRRSRMGGSRVGSESMLRSNANP